jgi:two-component system, LytTR family, sensor histidine kinase AlgZ
MHPIFRSKSWLAAYIAGCAVLGGMLAALLHGPGGTMKWTEAMAISEPLFLFYAFVCLTPWYMCRQLPLTSTNKVKIAVYHGGAAVLATALWIGLARAIGYALNLGNRIDPVISPLIAIGILLYLFSVALHYALLAMEAARRAALEARDAELRALKAQINPHFLFNSLNSIIALTASDPGKARSMCLRLADFLRNTLGLGECECVALNEELNLAQAYLDVEQIRFGPRLQVELRIDEKCRDCMVPPLILQPLIENAVKYGIATLAEGGTIRVESLVREGQLRVIVENRFDPKSAPPRKRGLGLRNVRRRLETRFGSSASLAARTEDDRFLAEISMPCRTVESL